MNSSRRLLAAAAFAVVGTFAHAHSFKIGEIDIGHPYARPTVAGQPGGGYLSLDNHGADDRLVAVSAAIATSTQIHSMSMQGDVMKMRQVDVLDVPAGRKVELKPGGYHFMFMGLKAPLKAGDRFPMKLKFEKAGEVEVTVNVEAPGDAGAMAHSH